MKKLMMTVAIVIGMIAATFANDKEVKLMLDNEKEVKLTVNENKLHYNYYSPLTYEGIVVNQASKLVLVTENGIEVVLSANDKLESQKGFTSESITISFELTDSESKLFEEKKIVEVKLQHANGTLYSSLQKL